MDTNLILLVDILCSLAYLAWATWLLERRVRYAARLRINRIDDARKVMVRAWMIETSIFLGVGIVFLLLDILALDRMLGAVAFVLSYIAIKVGLVGGLYAQWRGHEAVMDFQRRLLPRRPR